MTVQKTNNSKKPSLSTTFLFIYFMFLPQHCADLWQMQVVCVLLLCLILIVWIYKKKYGLLSYLFNVFIY